MLRTVEAMIAPDGQVKLKEDVLLKAPARVLVTFLDDSWEIGVANEPAILSEPALAPGWIGAEADAAWKHLEDLPALEEAE